MIGAMFQLGGAIMWLSWAMFACVAGALLRIARMLLTWQLARMRRNASSSRLGGNDMTDRTPEFSLDLDAQGVPTYDQFAATLPLHEDSYNFSYRTPGRFTHQMTAVRQSNGRYEVMLRNRRNYGGRASDGHSTHRFDAGTGSERICFASLPTDLPDACRKAVFWALRTEDYILNGRRF